MRFIITTILLFFFAIGYSTQYYVGAGGSNSNTGLSIAQRWLNITKVNSFTFSAGDSILMAAGETFAGGLKVPSNGVIIASYGIGAKPVISGFVTLGSWTSLGGNIYECTPSQTLKSTCNVLTINDNPYAVGRYPNNTYLTYQSANTTTLTSAALTGTPSYVGAEVVMKKNVYTAEKARITAQSSNVLTYTTTKQIDNNTAVSVNGTSGYGFFLQRFAGSLDQQGEWFFNSSTNKMQIYSTVNPSTLVIKASCIDTVIYIGSHTNVTVTNLAIEGGSLYGTYSVSGTNVKVINCDFNNNTRAIYYKNGVNLTVMGNVINNSMCNAILLGQLSKQVNVLNNTITNTGVFLGMGLFWSSYDLKGIGVKTDATTSSNYINVIGNSVIKTGYMGIDFRGSNITVRRNVVDTFCFHLDDGGGIYTWVNNSSIDNTAYLNRFVDSNFISNSIGAPEGSTGILIRGNGLYIDDQAKDITMTNNTIWNIRSSGIIQNNPKNNIVSGNTVYNCGIAFKINMKPYGALANNFVTRNIFYSKLNTQYNFAHINYNLSVPTPITIAQSLQGVAFIDTNYITNTKSSGNGITYYYSTNGSGTTFPPDFNLATWRSSYVHDLVSILPPVTVTNTNTTLYTNPTDSLMVVNFAGFRKLDPQGNIYDHQITVGRWSSIVLIDNGLAPTGGNIPPTVNAGVDKTVNLPTNSTSVTATSTLGSGTSISYLWTEIAGPNTATNSSPTSATTTFGGFIAGTYQMKVRGLNNLNDSAIDFMQITVNAANQPPVANVGADQSIQLPQNYTTVSGAASTDPEGGALTYSWTKISGPTGGTVDNPTSSITQISNFVAGIYRYSLVVTDAGSLTSTAFIEITVLAIVPPANQPPVAVVSANQIITLPTSSTSINATGSSDPEGGALTFKWLKISGPAGGTITSSTSAITNVSALQQGVYSFQVTVKDPSLDSSTAALSITVNAQPLPPTVNAGVDQSFTLPMNSTSLTAIGNDPEGGSIAYHWVKISGPTGGTIGSPNSATTAITSLVEGVYIYSVTATDPTSLTGSDAVQITVNPVPPLLRPVADAGIGQTIVLPQDSTVLIGTGNDVDGTITGYVWRKISGPIIYSMVTPCEASTDLLELVEGTYQFELTVTDNDGLQGKDTIQVIVSTVPTSGLPTANAGGDIITTDTVVTLNGAGSDSGSGFITTYSWVKISGNVGDAIVSPNSATTVITGLIIGVYEYELTVTDDEGNTATDRAVITVTEFGGRTLLRFYKTQ